MGLFLGLILGLLPITLLQKVVVLIFSVFGSLFPDIDMPTSMLGRKIKLIGWLFKHRGFFHGLIALLIFTFLIILVSNVLYGLSFAVGFISHLLLDSFSKEGVNIFGRKFRGILKVGGFVEFIIQITLFGGILLIFFYNFWTFF